MPDFLPKKKGKRLKLQRKQKARQPAAPPPVEADLPLPDDPWQCVRELATLHERQKQTSDPDFKLPLKDRIRKLQLHLKEHHADVWDELRKQAGQVKRRQAAPDVSSAAAKKPTRQTKQDRAEARQRLLKLSLNELVESVSASADALIDFCKAPDNYGVLMLRPVMQVLRPDTTAALVLCQLLYWGCRRKDGRTRVGKQNWLRKTHADLANETGVTEDQVRGALQRLKRLGLCDKARGCRTGLLEPNLQAIASGVWTIVQSGQAS